MNHYTKPSMEKHSFQPVDENPSQLSWWVQITTISPSCIYYFGPFEHQTEATVAQYEYIQDLLEEKAKGIDIEITKTKPEVLTIYEEDF
ncbi:hypothetical protein H1P_510004 [Hyella patelloides LEGE 07179]|uniref:DUF1816 domain-containing protein n=1 Tax=Hyella patelloides LEGE 07179 TaxID=945734 RepID=A0A563VZN7_9CYAN|nr:DUF1816 domain-containing protein [Hyella patelloides]VEP16901.1 hypothetical protein H1P_510004 [Hyella patelloides LEGE 07179]